MQRLWTCQFGSVLKAWSFFAAAITAVIIAAPAADASIISAFVGGLGPHLDHHNDTSHEYLLVDAGDDGIVNKDDVFSGIALFSDVGKDTGPPVTNRLTTNGSGGFELTAVFQALVTGKSGNSTDGFVFTLGPNPAFEALYGTGAMIALFEGSPPDFDATAAGGVLAAIATASDGVLQAVLGITGRGGEGWSSMSTTDDVNGLPAQSAGGNSYAANLNLVLGGPAGNGDYSSDLIIAFSQPSSFAAPGTAFTQFAVSGQFFGGTATPNFPISDSTDIFFETVPEPASVLAWLGLLASACGVCFLPRNRG